MTAEFQSAFDLIGQLNDAFPGTETLIVGGAVRDYLLSIEAHDVDIATNIPFDLLSSRFELKDITKNTVHAQPVSVIVFNGIQFEIAQFRTDSVGTSRKNNVAALAQSFDEDSTRRDITINALGLDFKKTVIDPQGGRLDLINNIIRCVGDPDIRFYEDATRILRVLRFAAKFNFKIESETAKSIVSNKNRLTDRAQISQESIGKEIFKAGGSGVQLSRFITLLDEFGISELILPEWSALNGFTHDPVHHPEGGSTVQGHILACLNCSLSNNPVSNIAILCHDLGKAVTRGIKPNGHSNYHGHEGAGVPIVNGIFDRLRFPDLSAKDKENILFATDRHMLIHNLNSLSIKKLTNLLHHDGWNTVLDVGYADEASRGPELFNAAEFGSKIQSALQRVSSIASNRTDLKVKVKEYVDGNKLLDWFPELQSNRTLISHLISFLTDFIVEHFDQSLNLNQDQIRKAAAVQLEALQTA